MVTQAPDQPRRKVPVRAKLSWHRPQEVNESNFRFDDHTCSQEEDKGSSVNTVLGSIYGKSNSIKDLGERTA